MHPHSQRIEIARRVRESADLLLEASERSFDARLMRLSSHLLDTSLALIETAGDLLELDGQLPQRPVPPARIRSADLPF